MKAVILVGGGGTRLRPLTCNRPKAMVPIVNQPFLVHVLGYLKRHNIDEVILAMSYLPQSIEAYFGDGRKLGIRLTYVVEDSPLGTSGAVRNVAGRLEETFFTLNGDIFTEIDLTSMLGLHRQKQAKATIALTLVEDPTIYGVVETDAEGRVRRFLEKPGWDEVTSNLINAGIYILEPEVLRYIPPHSHSMFEHYLFPLLLQKGEAVYSYPSSSYWIDIGDPKKYLRLHHELLSGRGRGYLSGSQGKKLGLLPTAQVKGRVIAGRDCTFSPGARLIGPTIFGHGCRVGEGTTVEGAVIWDNVSIGAGVRLRNCMIAANCFIGDNCWVGEGCVLGDRVVIGSDNRLAQGLRVWPGKRLDSKTLF